MDINEFDENATLVIALAGRLDSNSAKALEEVLPARMYEREVVLVDFEAVEFVSSAGLRILLKAAKIAKGEGHRLLLVNLKADVYEVFDISGFTSIFQIVEDRKSAHELLG